MANYFEARERGERHVKKYLEDGKVTKQQSSKGRMPRYFEWESYSVEYADGVALVTSGGIVVGVYRFENGGLVGVIEREHLPDALADTMEAYYGAL